MKDALRTYARERIAKCGRVRIANTVDVALRAYRAHFHGLLRCGSVWECPTCSAAIRAERARDVETVTNWHAASGGDAYLATLTVRHGLGHDLKLTRKGVARAWKKMQAGEPWQRFKQKYGMVGAVRAMEVTFGPNGFHPHIHVLLLLRSLSNAETDAAREFLSLRWQRAVEAVLGAENVPNSVHGCDLRLCAKVNYLTKLGLAMELVDPSGKLARSANRTPFEIAVSFLQTGDEADAFLWQSYCKGMRGARMLTWTAGLRAAAKLGVEKSDLEITEGIEADEEIIYSIPGNVWQVIRDRRGISCQILESAETGGAEAVRQTVARGLRLSEREAIRSSPVSK